MKEMKFTGAINLVMSKNGIRTTPATNPIINVGPTFNNFTLNTVATKLMGLNDGDYVTMFTNGNATNINEKYFIVKTKVNPSIAQAKIAFRKKKDEATGVQVVIAEESSFRYSGIFADMINTLSKNDVNATTSSKEDLVFNGLVVDSTCTLKVIADISNTNTLVPIQDAQGNVIEEAELFCISNFKSRKYEVKTKANKSVSQKVEKEEVEEIEETEE